MFKVIVVCSLVVFASAGLLPEQAYEHEVHAPAQYDFAYSVHDSHTGDVKQQQESRRGDVVQGSYSLVEPDGHKRIVHYAADAHNGFNAVVQREGTVHQQPIAHAAPLAVAHAAPLAVAHAAPLAVAHAAPALAVSHAAPLAVAHSAPTLAVSHGISHQTYSAPVLAHQTYAAAPQIVSHQYAAAPAIQQLGYAGQHVGYAGQQVGYAGQQVGYAGQQLGYGGQHNGYGGHGIASHGGYSTVSQVTHHGGYHH